jgi:hypothetical protein
VSGGCEKEGPMKRNKERKIKTRNFDFMMGHLSFKSLKSCKTSFSNPPRPPSVSSRTDFSKGGNISPPFGVFFLPGADKGRWGGILESDFKQLN